MIWADDDILIGFAQKDERAYEAIYKRYYKLVYNICYRITSNTQSCEDCSINVFTKLFQSHATFSTLGKMVGYIVTSARNISLNSLRNSKLRSAYEEDYSITLDEEWESINDELDYRFIRALKLIKEDMSNEPIRSVQVLKMLYFEKKTYFQIGEILGITFNTVSNLRAQGIIHLQKLISRESI